MWNNVRDRIRDRAECHACPNNQQQFKYSKERNLILNLLCKEYIDMELWLTRLCVRLSGTNAEPFYRMILMFASFSSQHFRKCVFSVVQAKNRDNQRDGLIERVEICSQ